MNEVIKMSLQEFIENTNLYHLLDVRLSIPSNKKGLHWDQDF